MGDAADSSMGHDAEHAPVTARRADSAAVVRQEAAAGAPAPSGAAGTAAVKASADTTEPAARPSGLKLPSKIGRLCSHATPKPAVPVSPRVADGSSAETLRKYSSDYSRKHLAVSSTYSATSMDALWERHPRKLSEAGLRRSSDHSVVLTEDTDSFIIGERVWVGGSKPGQIAYIGETQFAPGEWAGIVLDEPIGKNDGSVAGVRYFQCADRRGVFSRLTRLTRAPLIAPRSPHAASPSSDAGSAFSPAAARHRGALSPSGSVRSAFSSKMNASVTSSANGGELRLGERVIVSSSRGSKAGVLRFAGAVEFARGLWCGVELDDPIGKNDGSVDGTRYFECAPRFGLFAPASKVSRSPSSRRPGACAVHSGRSARRSSSRESLASSARTPAGLAAQRGGPRAASTAVSAERALQVQYVAAR